MTEPRPPIAAAVAAAERHAAGWQPTDRGERLVADRLAGSYETFVERHGKAAIVEREIYMTGRTAAIATGAYEEKK